MPRQDVPYGGAICRLKERIAEIWDRLDQKLHTINGVEGDGAGNVEIVSGDAAITVSESPTGHFIEIGLDHGNLPSAAVSSVNGQTGAVELDAADIPSEGNSNVQADISFNKTLINDCFDSIATEQNTRHDADAELQANINAVQASIPGAAAAAVSNDPTVTQLAADVPGKLDKISSGSALKAYTHTGQSQGETAVVNGVDADSIGLRDRNGRMQAADPAGGATDKTLVTANWVSQTGDSAPNNLIHRSGVESKTGDLILYNKLIMRQFGPNSAINLRTPANRSTFNAVFGDMINWDDTNGNRIISVRFSQDVNGGVAIEWLFHKPDGSQINIGKFGITADGAVIKTGIFA